MLFIFPSLNLHVLLNLKLIMLDLLKKYNVCFSFILTSCNFLSSFICWETEKRSGIYRERVVDDVLGTHHHWTTIRTLSYDISTNLAQHKMITWIEGHCAAVGLTFHAFGGRFVVQYLLHFLQFRAQARLKCEIIVRIESLISNQHIQNFEKFEFLPEFLSTSESSISLDRIGHFDCS